MLPIYQAIVLNPIVSVMSASGSNGNLSDWQLEQLDTPEPLFDVNQQVSLLENAGYNVYILYRYDKVHLISAILPEGNLTHFQWIMAFSEHWSMSAY